MTIFDCLKYEFRAYLLNVVLCPFGPENALVFSISTSFSILQLITVSVFVSPFIHSSKHMHIYYSWKNFNGEARSDPALETKTQINVHVQWKAKERNEKNQRRDMKKRTKAMQAATV